MKHKPLFSLDVLFLGATGRAMLLESSSPIEGTISLAMLQKEQKKLIETPNLVIATHIK